MRRKIMMMCLALVVIVGALLAACAKPAPTPTPSPTATPTPTPSPAAKPLHWKFAVLYPRGTSFDAIYEQLGADVEHMSGGRLKIEVMYSGEGVEAPQMLDACASGLIQMAQPYPALHAGVIPAGVIELGLPGGPMRASEIGALFEVKGWKKVLRECYAEHNVYWLASGYGPGTYLLTKKPISTLDDLKKMKIRAPGAYGEMLSNLGASTVTMAFGEVYTALATGVIDGVDGCNLIDHRDGRFYEVAKYLYPLPLTASQNAPYIVNLDAWKGLSDDLKAILERAAARNGLLYLYNCTVWEKQALGEMLNAGLKYSPMPSASDEAKWREAGMKTWDTYAAKDAYCAELIKIEREFMKELGYIK